VTFIFWRLKGVADNFGFPSVAV